MYKLFDQSKFQAALQPSQGKVEDQTKEMNTKDLYSRFVRDVQILVDRARAGEMDEDAFLQLVQATTDAYIYMRGVYHGRNEAKQPG